ncbi:hypothetical protein [Mesorhizobium mediterraneum]|uniref:hypothetical protein n=1 Tax=Mesorhizobium mediterraneum TaxID=43617 RepID=UPI00177DE95E|nr:hypothetical protein [Mesorhizobium mediterraneum]
MLIQAVLFAWVYEQAFARRSGTFLSRGLVYAAFGAVLSWSFTTLAVAAKNVMASVPDYLTIETAFTVVQWLLVGPLTAFASVDPPHETRESGCRSSRPDRGKALRLTEADCTFCLDRGQGGQAVYNGPSY